MTDFVDKLRLKGKSEEDIFFAKRDRELLEALHAKRLHKVVECEDDAKRKVANAYEKRFKKLTKKHKAKPKKLARACKELIAEIMDRCSKK
jgi:hypothetical protein